MDIETMDWSEQWTARKTLSIENTYELQIVSYSVWMPISVFTCIHGVTLYNSNWGTVITVTIFLHWDNIIYALCRYTMELKLGVALFMRKNSKKVILYPFCLAKTTIGRSSAEYSVLVRWRQPDIRLGRIVKSDLRSISTLYSNVGLSFKGSEDICTRND